MVNPNQPPPPINTEQVLQIFNGVSKVSFTYTNGSTLTLEGESMTSFVAFQRLLLGIFSTVTSHHAESTPQAQPPLTRTTLADELKNKKGSR